MKRIHTILGKAAAFALAGVMAFSLAGCGVEIKLANPSASEINGQTATPSNNTPAATGQTGKPSTNTPAANTPTDKPGQTAPLALYPGYADMPVGFTMYLDCQTSKKNQIIEWSSSNPAVASVDADGKITGVAPGEAVIMAKLKSDPSVTATCGVYVEDTQRKTVVAWKQEPAVKPGDAANMSQAELLSLLNGKTTEPPTEEACEVPIEADPGEGETEIIFDEAAMQKEFVKDVTWRMTFATGAHTLGRESTPIKYFSPVYIVGEKKGGDTPLGKYQNVKSEIAYDADTSDYIAVSLDGDGYGYGSGQNVNMPPDIAWKSKITLYTIFARGFLSADGGYNENTKEHFFDAFMYFADDPIMKDNNRPYVFAGGSSNWIWTENYEQHSMTQGGVGNDVVYTDNAAISVRYLILSGNRAAVGLRGFVPDSDEIAYMGQYTHYIKWRQVK